MEQNDVSLPQDWEAQVSRAYSVFGINPIDGVDEFAFGPLDLDFLREKAKKQFRDIIGRFREMRGKLKEEGKEKRLRLTEDGVEPLEKSKLPEPPGETDLFEPPIRPQPRVREANKPAQGVPRAPAKPEGAPDRTDPYADHERDAEGRVIMKEENLRWFMGDNSLKAHLSESVDSKGNKVTVLSKDREALHRELVNRVLDGIKPPVGRNPLEIFLGGGSGAGKSSATKTVSDFPRTRELKDYGKEGPGEAALIDADAFKAEMPEWETVPPDKATSFVHTESGLIADLAIKEAHNRGVDTIIDGTGDTSAEVMREKFENAKKAGYDIAAMYVTTPTSEALVRATSRGVTTGRYVAPPVLDRIHKSVSEVFGQVSKDFGAKLDLYDADVPRGAPALPIIRDGKVVDQKKLDAFMEKQNISLKNSAIEAVEKAKDEARKYDSSKTMTSDEVKERTIHSLEALVKALEDED